MPYASVDQVAALCRNLLGTATQFGSSTSPTVYEVESFLSSGCSAIEIRLSAAGYDVPVAAGSRAYDFISHLNTLYGAAYAEMSRTNVVLGPGERTRGQQFLAQFNNEIDGFISLDLTGMGISRSSRGEIYVGGTSKADVNSNISDTDRVPPRFFRGMLQTSGTLEPSESTLDTT